MAGANDIAIPTLHRGYEVQLSDLQRALAARGAECDRQQAELRKLQDSFQAGQPRNGRHEEMKNRMDT